MEEKAGGKLIQRFASASTESDHQLEINFERTTEESSKLHNCCIYKVPNHLRKLNEESYTPQVISIGPLHHKTEELKKLEEYKRKYFDHFVGRAQTSREDLVRIVKDNLERVRECYAENIRLDSDELVDQFVDMILYDATFIIEYFLRNMNPEEWTDEDKKVLNPRVTSKLQLDFLLLENQLPFFIIEKLYDQLVLVTDAIYQPSFIEVTVYFFKLFNTQDCWPSVFKKFEIMHFVDLLRGFYLPPYQEGRFLEGKYGSDHCVEEMYCASQLAEAGLIFKKSASRCQFDLKFADGVLEIPGFTLDKNTELCARNLMALEHLHYPTDEAYITDYFRLLDFLIDTDKDVGLLRRKKILVNRLGDKCATIVNNLCSDYGEDTPSTLYYPLCRDLVRFYNNPWNSWKIKLRHDLSTPWVIVTTAGGVFLLVLTLVQTVCTVISTVKN